MAITLRQTAFDTLGKTTELSYQEMNNNLKTFIYSGSFNSSTSILDLHFLSGSTSHSIDLSSLAGADSYVSNVSLVGTNLTFTGAGSAFNSTVDLSSLSANIGNTSLSLTSNRTLDLNGSNLSFDALQGETFTFTADSSATVLFQMDDGDFKINGLPNTETPLVLGYNSSTGLVSYYSTGSFGGGVGTPGRSDGQMQYNNGGAFGGDSGLTWDDSADILSVKATGTNPSLRLSNGVPSTSAGTELAEIVGRSEVYSTDVAAVKFVADGTYGGGDYPTRIELQTVQDGGATLATKFQVKNNGQLIADEYGSGTFTGTAAKWLAVDSSGNVIEEDTPSGTGFTRPGSATSINYDTYLQDAGFDVDSVGTSPTAPSGNGEVAVRYAVSNIGSNVDRIDVYKLNGSGTDRSQTLENLAVSGSIVLLQVGAGSHTERYRIISTTDNSTYMSYAVEWESGDDAAITTDTTDTLTFNSDYEYELSTGYNRLLVNNDSNSTAQRFRFAPPAAANAGDEVIVEIARNTSSINIQLAYVIRSVSGDLSFYHDQDITELSGTTIQKITLAASGESAMIRFQVNDIGATQGLTLLGANRFVYS